MVDNSYLDIGEYGIIGNLETIALVGNNGSIDWFCAPHLESTSVFARILDAAKGGHFSITPSEPFESHQEYLPKTNVLKTTFRTESGNFSVIDFMPIEPGDKSGKKVVLRKVKGETGSPKIEIEFSPRFNYARSYPKLTETNGGIKAGSEEIDLVLRGPVDFSLYGATAKSKLDLGQGDEYWFSLQYGPDLEKSFDRQDLLARTKEYWKGWAHDCEEETCVFGGPWHDLAVRSGLLLKLLTHPETGAIAAAPTTSLPEEIGGIRNWDYRFSWIRDASMTIQSLYHLGHETEAKEYFGWLRKLGQVHGDPNNLQIMYSLHGETDLEEEKLDHLAGYRNSHPVRIGNAASNQKQLDIYGELVNAFYETCPKYGEEIRERDWDFIRKLANHVTKVWDQKDSGIWEVRGEPRHFLYSKLMCWLALDRAIKIRKAWGFHGPFDIWRKNRDQIKKAILKRGYSEKIDSFVQSFGRDNLDATGLLIPVFGLLPADDKRVINTVDRTIEDLTSSDGLVYRYNGEDGLQGSEGAFLLCSFWLVRALTEAGRLEEAEGYLENLVNYASPAGLLAEEIDPSTGKQLGNFPQAFSHIGLINSSLHLGNAYEQEGQE